MEFLPQEWKSVALYEQYVGLSGMCEGCGHIHTLAIGREFLIAELTTNLKYKCGSCGSIQTIKRIAGPFEYPKEV